MGLDQSFACPPCTKALYLNSNLIGDEGVQFLAASIACGWLANLLSFWLQHNLISDVGAAALINSIRAASLGLQYLRLDSNDISFEGALALTTSVLVRRIDV